MSYYISESQVELVVTVRPEQMISFLSIGFGMSSIRVGFL